MLDFENNAYFFLYHLQAHKTVNHSGKAKAQQQNQIIPHRHQVAFSKMNQICEYIGGVGKKHKPKNDDDYQQKLVFDVLYVNNRCGKPGYKGQKQIPQKKHVEYLPRNQFAAKRKSY